VQLRREAERGAGRYYGLLEKRCRTTTRRRAGNRGVLPARSCCGCLEDGGSDNVSIALASPPRAPRARQLVRHGQFHVNGRRVNLPATGQSRIDIVSMAPGSSDEQGEFLDATDLTASVAPCSRADHGRADREDPELPGARRGSTRRFSGIMIVELYSKY